MALFSAVKSVMRYLGCAWIDDSTFEVGWADDPVVYLEKRSGRASPLFPLISESAAETTLDSAIVAFLFPLSPRGLFAALRNDYPSELIQSAYMTHGLAACVLVLDAALSYQEALDKIASNHLMAYEVWPVHHGRVRRDSVNVWHRSGRGSELHQRTIGTDGLPAPIELEVQQFNANIAILASSAQDFFPEYDELTDWLLESVTHRVEAIRADIGAGESISSLSARLHHDVSILVDVNSCLSMVISQTSGVVPPIFNSSYPVGAFSLVGIGSVARAAWKFYNQLATVFARADHVSRIRSAFATPGFDPAFYAKTIDFASWERASKHSVAHLSEADDRPGRKHLVYFSSRWGFHETLNSISLSWQSITACATRQWNILTLTHEFLHSHFRELVRTNLFDIRSNDGLAALCRRHNEMAAAAYRRHNGTTVGDSNAGSFNFQDSFRTFLINQLNRCRQAESWANGGLTEQENPELLIREVSPSEVSYLMQHQMPDMVEEFIVHMMDFQYFFDGDDGMYVSSLWHSWSLVPFVHKKLSHYILRSLLALASTKPFADPKTAFVDALNRLSIQFESMDQENPESLTHKALHELKNVDSCQVLWMHFSASFPLVPFARLFLIDGKLNSMLTTESWAGEGQKYNLVDGEFPSEQIESPAAFLLDRYDCAAAEPDDVAASSLWQFLVIL